MHESRHVVTAIKIDYVEPGLLAANGCINMHLAKRLDVGLVHGTGLDRLQKINRARRRAHRNLAAVIVRRSTAQMRGFDPCQSAIFVDRVNHSGQKGNVTVIPKSPLWDRAEF